MYEARTKPTEVSFATYLQSVEDPQRRSDCEVLAGLMTRITGCKPRMWGTSIVGFDQYHYQYASGHEGDSCIVGFSSHKGPISVYRAAGCDVDHTLLPQLGKHKIGKPRLYIDKLADVKLAVLEQLLVREVAETKKRYPSTTKKGRTRC